MSKPSNLIVNWNYGCNYLLKKDLTFKKYYSRNHFLKINKNKFDVLFKSICSQQISVSAAMSIYAKSKKIIGPINYSNFKRNRKIISNLPISKNKKKSINSIIDNYSKIKKITSQNKNYEFVKNQLIPIFGIGKWTVDMFCIFHLGLLNILPIGDLGFINAYKKFYKDPNLQKLAMNMKKWGDFTTIVTWYLWSSYDEEPLYL